MNNAISFIKDDLANHRVTVTLPHCIEESLYLIMLCASASKLDDFVATYGDAVTSTHKKIAEKVFGSDLSENVYGVFIDDKLQMVYAFNRDFANYDTEKKQIVYKDIDDVLIERIGVKKEEFTPSSKIIKTTFWPNSTFPNRSGDGTIRYSLAEKEKT